MFSHASLSIPLRNTCSVFRKPVSLSILLALELVKVSAIGIVGGAAIGVGMGIKGLLDK